MSIIVDDYYSRSEVSNSKLTEIDNYFKSESYKLDLEAAFKFGSLVDAMITEPEHVDYFNYRVQNVQYNKIDFNKAIEMVTVFKRDPFCVNLAKMSVMQKVSIKNGFEIDYQGIKFKLDVRCKWDFFVENLDMSGDLKTTACTSQKQFEESIYHYDYHRQAAWYMDIEGKNNFMFIAISKVNNKIFKVPVKRGDKTYYDGKSRYQELAFRYWTLFGEVA